MAVSAELVFTSAAIPPASMVLRSKVLVEVASPHLLALAHNEARSTIDVCQDFTTVSNAAASQ
jgi:hypothetical protein